MKPAQWNLSLPNPTAFTVSALSHLVNLVEAPVSKLGSELGRAGGTRRFARVLACPTLKKRARSGTLHQSSSRDGPHGVPA